MVLRYVIQKHHARNLHYDLRLEHEGAAKSWALPKEPLLISGVKRLAVSVPDHEIGYMDFEGTIEKGSYGAGKVEIWDKGTWIPEEVTDRKITGLINGEKIKGRFALINFKEKNWLFFRA